MATAWNGRVAAIQEQGAPVAIGWRQGGLRTDAWAVPKGAANRENAMKFTAFITLPVPQARLWDRRVRTASSKSNGFAA
jgi:putative spermidine/putrescine transport system substrate-binding protein